VSSVIPRSPILLSPIFSTVARLLSVVLLILVIRACPFYSHKEHLNVEKHGLDHFRFPNEFPVRGSSPSADTWPFPAFLALSRSNPEHASSSPGNNSMVASLGSSFPFRGGIKHANTRTKSTSTLIFPILAGSQIFALLCAAIKIVMAVIVSHTTETNSNQGAKILVTVWHLVITHGVGRSVWAVLLLTVIYGQFSSCRSCSLALNITHLQLVMPPKPLLVPSVQVRPPKKQSTLRPFIPGIRTPRPSFSRFLSPDSASDYLSVPDPFASIPPPLPPPPAVPVGLDLVEVDDRCHRGKEIRVQYRFAAPRSRTWRKSKSKKSRSTSGKWSLDHKSSAQSLGSCPPLLTRNGGIYAGRADGTDQDKDRTLRDEATLAQLLLQSLNQAVTEDLSTAPTNENSPITTLWRTSIPRALYTPPRSRWSSGSTVMSATTVRPSCSSMPQSRVSSTSAGVGLSGGVTEKVPVDIVPPRPSVSHAYDEADATVVSEKS